jgi:ribosomal protein S18 acetylase RimI-like enzyme
MPSPNYLIVPMSEAHVAGFHAAFSSVAAERRYLGRTRAPPISETLEWVKNGINSGHPRFAALVDGKVVGWCDVTPERADTLAHGAVLGMGVLDGFRGQGIGSALMRATLESARKAGLQRIDLTVREDNPRAKALYEKFGFAVEGIKRKAALVDGRYYDLLLMSLLFEP